MFALVNNSQIIDICSSRQEQQYAKHLNIQIWKEARVEALLSRSKCITFLMGLREGGGGGRTKNRVPKLRTPPLSHPFTNKLSNNWMQSLRWHISSIVLPGLICFWYIVFRIPCVSVSRISLDTPDWGTIKTRLNNTVNTNTLNKCLVYWVPYDDNLAQARWKLDALAMYATS